MAEKYGLVQLVSEISEVIMEDLVITEENVMEVSETAEVYSCFENVSLVLFNKCSCYYRNIKYKLTSQVVHGQSEGELPCHQTSSSQPSDEERYDKTGCHETNRVKMSLKNVSWIKFLNNDTDLPRDITFKFFEKTKTTDDEGGVEEEVRFVGDIKAHKFLLASCSEVFKEH